MPNDDSKPTLDAEERALEHAWAWFSLHASQRMQVVSYVLVAFALVLAGYGAAMQAENRVVAVGIAATGIAIAVSFLLLEARTRELVQAAEPAIATLQARLAARASLPELELVKMVDKPTQKFRKYSFVIRALMSAAIVLLAGAGFVAALHHPADDRTSHQPRWPPPGHSHKSGFPFP
jgi:hypothetical protein